MLAKVPQVDPNRLYAAGHSSAGTMAILFAEHEPRLKACVAFASVVDVWERLTSAMPAIANSPPPLVQLIKDSSPQTHRDKLACPIFLFHATNDSTVPSRQSEAFKAYLDGQGRPATLVEVPTGGHYDSMIREGVPRAIEWVKGLPGSASGG